ncbi:mucin-5AC-like isoform X1 [Frieseomelitta varia]|uniref:mucin-5AC-like isoform X1 n=1 Tax=Frieseomelitta varia TaxID=561572 RepID=UPI001CB6B43E|nr:mucin-5AC-like isoform X1 [Frieseomelitta varia]
MWMKLVLLISCVVANALADNGSGSKTASVEEFVTSHRVPASIARPSDYNENDEDSDVGGDDDDDDDDDVVDVERKTIAKNGKHAKKVAPKLESFDKKPANLEPPRRFDFVDEDRAGNDAAVAAKRQVRVELENFGDTGVLHEDGVRRSDAHKSRLQGQRDSLIPGVRVSDEYPTTMMPVLTTPRETRAFDFVPVNIIRDDGKETSFRERNFGDFSDVSLVPAGTNSRIQVKKGPNGKDYEYEYVYYYYDEEDENKAGTADSAVTNSYDVPSRTTPAPRRGGSSTNRNKYTNVERSSTVEPASNEVIPNRNGNRGRQLVETEDVSEERLPTNTRFPPRSRSSHNTGTTEPSRTRGNRPRPSLDLVDSSSFRTHQEGPEFPQILPKGPVRFLGVTPNEENAEERAVTRGRARPQRVQEPAPVEEMVEDAPAPTTRRRPISALSPEIDVETRGSSRASEERGDEKEEAAASSPTEKARDKQSSAENAKREYEDSDSPSTISANTENPTTEYPSSMDKVALDLYAFVQQGQNNLVDASGTDSSSSDVTITSNEENTTDLAAATELSATTVTLEPITTTTTTTTAASPTESTTVTAAAISTTVGTTTTISTTTTTTESPTTTQAAVGRGKFRRPGIGGIATASRNRFKSNGGGSTSTEAPAEPTQRTRNRFGGNGSNGGGFKRNRPGQKQPPLLEEDAVQKESASSVQAERPSPAATTRGRFRGSGSTRSVISSTTATPSNGGSSTSSTNGVSRPSFNKLNINRRRGRPTTTAPNSSEESQESTRAETLKETAQESLAATPKSTSAVRARLPTTGVRPVIKPGARINLRPKQSGQSTTTAAPLSADKEEESSVDEPAGEGTEEETHEAPAETSPPPTRSTTVNPLNKLRNRNRLQVHPKTTTRAPVSLASRRSPLLPRRKATEPPVVPPSHSDEASEEPEASSSSEIEPTEPTSAETSTAASTKHEETRGLSGLLAPRRRITPRRPGQIISRE